MSKALELHYGIIHPTIEEQLREQGFYINGSQMFQKQREAINLLLFADVITDSESDRAFKRLHKHITDAVKDSVKIKA